MFQALRAGVLALALVSTASAALAQQNLVTNPEFDEDAVGWQGVQDFMSIAFDSDDVDGDEESGSGLASFNPTIELDTLGQVANDCIEGVIPGNTYTASTSFRIPTGQERTGSAGVRVAWFTSDDCSGVVSAFGIGASSGAEGAWFDLTPVELVAPGNAGSAEMRLTIDKPQVGGTLVVFFDDATLLPEPALETSAIAAFSVLVALRRSPRR